MTTSENVQKIVAALLHGGRDSEHFNSCDRCYHALPLAESLLEEVGGLKESKGMLVREVNQLAPMPLVVELESTQEDLTTLRSRHERLREAASALLDEHDALTGHPSDLPCPVAGSLRDLLDEEKKR